ncbi:P2Y purinoceptor 14 [Ambystoma mexicanum]|uniref:P2Y purinoceptor 14 n=1 Tax=Ambystoma mexicanum TaxID=8296 RepID=UPI0037E8E52A
MNSSEPDNPGASLNHCIQSTVVTKQVLPLAYGFLFIGSILLNGLNAWIFMHVSSNRSFVIYLKNIVFADLLMSITFPFKILADSGIGPWQSRVIVCRFSAVVFYLNMYIGIIFLGLISFDRYYKIVKPLQASFFQTLTYSKVICVGIWATMLFLLVPNMILTSRPATEETSKSCSSLKSELGLQWHKVSSYICLAIFLITFLLLIYFYTSISRKLFSTYKRFRKHDNAAKKRSHRNIFSIMLVFFVCFVPYHLSRIPYTLSQTGVKFSCESKTVLFYTKEITLLMSSANVCLDPVIYFLLCQPFRKLLLMKMHILKSPEAIETSRSKRSQTNIDTHIALKYMASSSEPSFI